SADHLARGESLAVSTEWRVAGPGQAHFALVPQSNLRAPAPATLAQATLALTPTLDLLPPSFSLSLPSDIPPGVYFLTVAHSSGPALTSAGRRRGVVHLAPIWVDDPGPGAPDRPLASFGPTIQLVNASVQTPSSGALHLNLLWRALAGVPRSYVLALRLRDAAGNEWASFDTQTGGGYYPTHLWRLSEFVPDFYNLSLPPGRPPGDYALALSLYDPVSLDVIGETTLRATVSGVTPKGDRQPRFHLTPEIALADVLLPSQITQGDSPELAASWLTTAAPGHAYRARWTLSGAQAFSQTLDLAPGSASTTWPADSFILGRARLSTPPTLAPGTYALSIQLLDDQDQPVGALATVGQVEVLGRPRTFDVPPMQTEVGAMFGDKLKLWGYNAEQTESELRLTLVWSALVEPAEQDYKFFVHLVNPVDGFVAAQVDAMPHDFSYPTALWVAGEVVTDTITLSLSDLAPGEYHLALGWYDPASPTLSRLPAFDVAGQRYEQDRVILPFLVNVP
ncbi:MAG: hypothetical protein ACRDH2_06020, partial [Anaerolineales bacterium]